MAYHQPYVFQTVVGGKTIAFETGDLARLAGGALTAIQGESVVLATATASKTPMAGIDFFPLSVDFEERLYAAGRIPGSFYRREGRPSTEAILTSRLIDRPLRPLFPKGFRHEVQIICTALSADDENPLDILAINAASAALMISDIPWDGPIGAVRVGYIDGQFVINPTFAEMEQSLLDLRLGGTADGILMVEAGANQVPEDIVLEAMRVGHEALQPLIALQHEMRAAVGKPKREFTIHVPAPEVVETVTNRVQEPIHRIIAAGMDKESRSAALDTLRAEMLAQLGETFDPGDLNAIFDDILKEAVRRRILDTGERPDGRDPKTIRPISCAVGILPRTHGSGLFTRGETQVLTIATLGTPSDAQTLDTLLPEDTKRYLHHYNFPPFSTGETWPNRGPRRREIGHGALAERALVPVIPDQSVFPYTLRLVSEVLTSNGSTSMASVCGSTLALMDAGVPIAAPVAGIAMGLISEGDVTQPGSRYVVLSDIQGMEDHLGDMDFKVAGTAAGITALQMDIKIKGLSYDLLRDALAQARAGRLYILEKMLETIPASRPSLSKYAPRILTTQIDAEKIGKVIGPGGKNVRRLQSDYNVKIDIEEDGTIYVAGGADAEKALEEIHMMTATAKVGGIYTGKVVRIEPYGAFVEILPGVDGMVHISQLADYRVSKVEDVVRVGDEIMVMVIDIDQESGKIRLSRLAVLEGLTPEEALERDRRTRERRGGGGGGGGEPRPRSDGRSERPSQRAERAERSARPARPERKAR
ncbi:MAG: polyribonucleotide nucleotidyltransferase [Anaerolineae bacterium]|nr:polyribonucleotide nucleotidyltransferase [Caldilineales bacterium]MDW8268781.1 polyribonucleotide nucleotidyltransferase [Anaerolineae bacterium]